MMHNLLAAAIGLTTGAAMAVAVSCVWCVLLLPARIQDVFRGGAPRCLGWAMCLGLMLATLQNAAGFSLMLPESCAAVFFLPAGMFVGMLASALGEILEVLPVLTRRFRLGDVSLAFRFVICLAKGLGAVVAVLAFTQ